jgi:hypothetical protein
MPRRVGEPVRRRPLDRTEWTALIAVAIVLFVIGAPVVTAAVVVSPEAIERGEVGLGGPCPYRARHGVGCISCGLTRGLAAAGSGRLALAWRYHPAAVPLFLLACGATGASLATLVVAARRSRRALAA